MLQFVMAFMNQKQRPKHTLVSAQDQREVIFGSCHGGPFGTVPGPVLGQ